MEKLDGASRRVDRMLQELAHVNLPPRKAPTQFPLGFGVLSASSKSVASRRELSSTCHTEYDNAESEAAFSDSEFLPAAAGSVRESAGRRRPRQSRLSQLMRSLDRRRRGAASGGPDADNDADIDSNCSSVASSMLFGDVRWKSVHSIGYENEYEFVGSEPEEGAAGSRQSVQKPAAERGAVGLGLDCRAMDAESDEEEEPRGSGQAAEAARQVQELSQDIRRNFGDFQLASFPGLER